MTFSGVLRDSDRQDHNVGCPCGVTVEAPEPSATRSFNPATVEPGGEVVVTLAATGYGESGGSHGNAACRVQLRIQQSYR